MMIPWHAAAAVHWQSAAGLLPRLPSYSHWLSSGFSTTTACKPHGLQLLEHLLLLHQMLMSSYFEEKSWLESSWSSCA
jgi:hypothetical protein